MTTRRSGFQHRGPRRTTDWGLGPQTAATSMAASGTFLWGSGTSLAQNFTVVRTRGWLHVVLTTVSGPGAGFEGASGIYMMTEDAFTVGVTAALDPISDANSDMWLWHSFFDVRAITGTISDGVNAGSCHVRQEIDSKAMRKGFDPERVMVGVTEVIEIGTCVAEVFADTRQLFKN